MSLIKFQNKESTAWQFIKRHSKFRKLKQEPTLVSASVRQATNVQVIPIVVPNTGGTISVSFLGEIIVTYSNGVQQIFHKSFVAQDKITSQLDSFEPKTLSGTTHYVVSTDIQIGAMIIPHDKFSNFTFNVDWEAVQCAKPRVITSYTYESVNVSCETISCSATSVPITYDVLCTTHYNDGDTYQEISMTNRKTTARVTKNNTYSAKTKSGTTYVIPPNGTEATMAVPWQTTQEGKIKEYYTYYGYMSGDTLTSSSLNMTDITNAVNNGTIVKTASYPTVLQTISPPSNGNYVVLALVTKDKTVQQFNGITVEELNSPIEIKSYADDETYYAYGKVVKNTALYNEEINLVFN